MSNKQTCTRCEGEIADDTRDVEIERLRTFEAAVRSWVESGCWTSGIPTVREALEALDTARKPTTPCKKCKGHGFVWIREMSCRCSDCKGKGVIEVTP